MAPSAAVCRICGARATVCVFSSHFRILAFFQLVIAVLLWAGAVEASGVSERCVRQILRRRGVLLREEGMPFTYFHAPRRRGSRWHGVLLVGAIV